MKRILSMLLLLLPTFLLAQTKTYQVASTPTVWSSVQAGKWYKFQQGGDLSSYHMTSNGSYMHGITGAAVNESSVWTLESVSGGYMIKNGKGEYIALSTATSAKYWTPVSTDAAQAAVFKLSLGNANANNCLFTITTPPAAGYAYLHFDATSGSVANCGFYHDASGKNSQFQLYEVTVTEGGTDPDPETPNADEIVFNPEKTYVIHRFGNAQAYMYVNGGNLLTMALRESNKACFWQFEPTGNPNCYYIRNLRTGQYIQSAVAAGFNNLVTMGDTPVEYVIGHDRTAGANTNNDNYYYFASADNGAIQVETDGPLGLNFGANGVVSYYIKTGRGNSYWEVEEREPTDPVAEPIVKPDLAKRLGIVRIPCGIRSAYLTELSIVLNDKARAAVYSYSASSAPSSAYVNFKTTDFFTVMPGETYTLSLTAANTTADTDVRIFVDWDNDGEYEVIEVEGGSADIFVPFDAAQVDSYMRVRLNDNGLNDMDQDFEGSVYDFRMRVELSGEVGIDSPLSTPNSQLPTTYTLDGRRVHNPKQPGLYVVDGKKYMVK